MKLFDIAVIGAGAAGSMAALRGVLNNKETIVFLGDASTKKKARDTWVNKVVNMPMMFDRKRAIASSSKEVFDWINGDEYFSKKLESVAAAVEKVTKVGDLFELTTRETKKSPSQTYQAKYVVLCTGIMDVQPEINGSIQPILPYANEGHIDYCIRCDGHKVINKSSATIGHTTTAAWVAILLHERYQPPEMKIFLNGKPADFAGDQEIEDLLKLYSIKVVPGAITDIKGNPKEALEAFVVDGVEEKVDIAFPMLGQIAYNELAQDLGADLTDRGNVVTNDKGESSIAGLYVAGDLRAGKKYQIYTAWDMAVDAVDDIDAKLRREFRAKTQAGI